MQRDHSDGKILNHKSVNLRNTQRLYDYFRNYIIFLMLPVKKKIKLLNTREVIGLNIGNRTVTQKFMYILMER